MRRNLPINDVEVFIGDRAPIVTKTNLEGKIIYANPEFIRVSGFSEQELLGQDHNIVRHPDMPPAAFADLWQTLKRGQTWQGLVKNRSKNGDYYWVKAHVSPLYETGRHVGYISVRTPPTTEEKRAAEVLYRAVNQGSSAIPATLPLRGKPSGLWIGLALLPMFISLGSGTLLQNDQVALLVNFAAACFSSSALWLFARRLGENCHTVQSHLACLNEGNFKLTIKPQGTKEFQHILSTLAMLRVNIQAVIYDVVSVSTHMAKAAHQAEEGADKLYDQNIKTQGNIGRIAAALEELAVSIQEISQTTRTGSAHAEHARVLADQGSIQMQASKNSMIEVISEVEKTNAAVLDLERISEDIGSVTNVIRGIADQTNLLALNAAIEAARAGEQGRGFAVVADEVRKLAEHTTSNTTGIQSSIDDLKMKITQIIAGSQFMSARVSDVGQHIEETAESLQALRQASLEVEGVTAVIANALEQQSSASNEVAQSMEEINNAAEQSSHSIEQNRAIACKLNNLNNDLNKLLHSFSRHM